MIEFKKTLEDALKEIRFTGRLRVFQANELLKVIDCIGELYEERLGEQKIKGHDLELIAECNYPHPLLDFCDESCANVLHASVEDRDIYRLWIGEQGYVFTAVTARAPKTELDMDNLPSRKIPRFDAYDIYSPQTGWWNVNKWKDEATLFFDDPFDVSIIYFMRKVSLTKKD